MRVSLRSLLSGYQNSADSNFRTGRKTESINGVGLYDFFICLSSILEPSFHIHGNSRLVIQKHNTRTLLVESLIFARLCLNWFRPSVAEYSASEALPNWTKICTELEETPMSRKSLSFFYPKHWFPLKGISSNSSSSGMLSTFSWASVVPALFNLRDVNSAHCIS